MKIRPWMIFPVLLCAHALLSPAGAIEKQPKDWDIRLQLTSKGQYSIKTGKTEFQGDFAYEAAWSGTIEEDDSDYLLYHANAETLRWEIHEKDASTGLLSSRTEKDSPGGPLFEMNYVLVENGRLEFHFAVEGFPLPLSLPEKNITLVLPCAKKEIRTPDVSSYDAFVVKGSNDIAVPQKDFSQGSSARHFRWMWKRYHSLGCENPPSFYMSSHEADVYIRITPRF